MNRIVQVIAGPTAGGKSSLALVRAAEANGVIINADSMQIYDALPLLTAQPGEADREAIPHRLYGVLPPDQTCSAQLWRTRAIEDIDACFDAGAQPFIVGGTGFYIDSLINGLSPIPDVPPDVRTQAVARQAELGNPAFHNALAAIDPAMAARLHANDTQRLIRAYEVITATGRSLHDWQALPRTGMRPDWRFDVTLVLPPRAQLQDNCNRRFDLMLRHGAVEEAAAYMNDPSMPEDAPVTHALGFRPLRDHLRGLCSLEEATVRAKTETRQYARRQVTWFRHQVKASATVVVSTLS